MCHKNNGGSRNFQIWNWTNVQNLCFPFPFSSSSSSSSPSFSSPSLFFFFFLKNSVCVKGGQGSECSAEHCYLPKTFWSGMCCILKYTQVTSQGKVTFNPLLALCANAITEVFIRIQLYFFLKILCYYIWNASRLSEKYSF